MGDRAAEPLLVSLRHPNWLLRWTAAGILGEIGGPATTAPLQRAAEEDSQEVVREQALRALRSR